MKKCFVKAVLLAIVAVFCLGTVAQAKDKKKKKRKKKKKNLYGKCRKK